MNDRASLLPNFLNLELGEFVSTTVRGSSDFRFFVFFPCAVEVATSIFAILSAAARGYRSDYIIDENMRFVFLVPNDLVVGPMPTRFPFTTACCCLFSLWNMWLD